MCTFAIQVPLNFVHAKYNILTYVTLSCPSSKQYTYDRRN